jgi:hypothetical protein
LEELGNIFSPESTNRIFRRSDFEDIADIKADITGIFVKVFQKDRFSFLELTFMYIVSKLKTEGILREEDLQNVVSGINSWSSSVKDTSYLFLICRSGNEVFTLLLRQDAILYLDSKTKKMKEILLDEAAKELNEKLI